MHNVRIDLNYLSRCLGRKPGTLGPQEAVAGSGWKQEVAAHRIDRATSKCVGATADAVPALGLGLRREESNFGHAASSDQTCHTSASSESESESSHAPLEICDGPCYASRSNASEPDVRLDGVSKRGRVAADNIQKPKGGLGSISGGNQMTGSCHLCGFS